MQRQPVRAPQPAEVSAQTGRKFTRADITGKGLGLPNRYGLHGREGWGKTSFAAFWPKPVFLQSKGETGLETLIDAGQLPETPHLPELQDWPEIRESIRFLIAEEHEYKTVVLDTLNSAERLLYDYVCQKDFNSDWGEKGFGGYQRGYEASMPEMKLLLNDLDRLRVERKVTVVLLVHTKVKSFRNPDGADYDRWVPDVRPECWSLTHKWLDAVLFGNFEVDVKQSKRDQGDVLKKGKAGTASSRMLYCQPQPAFDAKNRLGLPSDIYMGTSAKEGFQAFAAALKQGRAATAAEEAADGE